MEELNYLGRKCDAIEALKSRICKDLSNIEEIVSDLKNFFEANHDGFGGAKFKLDKHYQSTKRTFRRIEYYN